MDATYIPSSGAYNGRPGWEPPAGAPGDDRGLIDTVINMPIKKNRIVTRAPEEPFRLTFIDVTCLIINRMIGTGIFSSPQLVMKGVKSPGIAILFWLCGCIYGLSGAHVYTEYGLNVPRYVINGLEQSVPRSGGDLHYLQYVFSRPSYKKGVVVLSGVLFGISFICVGNMAGNCINCALRLMEAANPDKSEADFSRGAIRGIAIIIAIVPCLIHAFSRRGGILLNNFLAIVKVIILLFMIISTWVVAGGWSGVAGISNNANVKPKSDFGSSNEANGYAQAFLSVIFAVSGFEQPNYVLGEIKSPRKTYPRSMWWGVGIVSVLYMAVNICYMIIVPADAQLQNNVAQEFFDRIFSSSVRASQAFNAFMAISSFGNIVVMTYTAARMKQEIAKQGFLPFASFFAKNKDVSLGRLLMWLEGRDQKSKPKPQPNEQQNFDSQQNYHERKTTGGKKLRGRRFRFLTPANHMEKTPVGALVLHFVSCIVLIIATYNVSASDAYNILIGLITYLVIAWFGSFLALGILILRIRGPPATEPVKTPNHHEVPDQKPVKGMSWSQMTKGTVNPNLSVICGCFYLFGNLYPVITAWVPPTGPFLSPSVAWFVVPLASWCVLAFSAFWFLGFIGVAKYRGRAGRKTFVYQCEPEFDWAENPESQQGRGGDDGLPAGEASAGKRRGGLILVHETIYRTWEAKEINDLLNHRPGMNDGFGAPMGQEPRYEREQGPLWDELADTDFAGFGHNRGPAPDRESGVVQDPSYSPVQVQEEGNGLEQVMLQPPSGDEFENTDLASFRGNRSTAPGAGQAQEYIPEQGSQERPLQGAAQWPPRPLARKPLQGTVQGQAGDEFADTDLAGFVRNRVTGQ